MTKHLDITAVECRGFLEKMELKEAYLLLQKIEDNSVKIIKTDYKEGSHATYTMKIINPKSGYIQA